MHLNSQAVNLYICSNADKRRGYCRRKLKPNDVHLLFRFAQLLYKNTTLNTVEWLVSTFTFLRVFPSTRNCTEST